MVTGSNNIHTRCEYIDPAIEQLKADEGELSIFQWGDGLSFSLVHASTGKILLLTEYQLSSDPNSALELLSQFNEPFGSFKIGWKSPRSTWIPKALFDENLFPEYVKSTLGKGDFEFTVIEELEAVLIHEKMPAHLERVAENYTVHKSLPDPAIHALAIARHWKTRPGQHMYADYNKETLTMTAISNGKLLLQNTYHVATEEDALYYVLFAYEQLKFHQDEVPLKISGDLVEKHGLWSTLAKYIRDIEWLDNIGNIHPASAIPKNDIRLHAALIQNHTCG